MASGEVKIGIAGLGIGRYHLECFSKNEKTDVVAVADPDVPLAKRLAQKYNVRKVYQEYSELMADPGINAVVVSLPNFLHHTASIEAMRAGKHVLCEKPMAISASAAEEMVKTSAETGCQLMIAFNGRFKEETQFLKRAVDDGQMGEIYYAKAAALRRRGTPQIDFPPTGDMGRGHWFVEKDKAGSGALFDIGVHVLDSVLWLMGHPKAATVSGSAYDLISQRRFPKGEFSVEDIAVGFIRLENGATVTVESSWVANNEGLWQLKLFGTKGGAKTSPLTIYTESHGKLVDITPPQGAISSDSGYQKQADYFAERVAEGRAIEISTAEEGLEVTRILSALLRSAEERRELKREDWAASESLSFTS
jgi:predicted dehydrogenase